jgi:hypothetical protein
VGLFLKNYGVFGDKFTLTYEQAVLLATTSTVTSRNSEVGIMNRVPAERTRVLQSAGITGYYYYPQRLDRPKVQPGFCSYS